MCETLLKLRYGRTQYSLVEYVNGETRYEAVHSTTSFYLNRNQNPLYLYIATVTGSDTSIVGTIRTLYQYFMLVVDNIV